MSGISPGVTLFDSVGVELAVQPTITIPSGTSALLMAGSDSLGAAQTLLVDGYGRQVIVTDPSSPLAITGSISATNPSVGTNAATAPSSSTQIGALDPSTGNLVPLTSTTDGNIAISGDVMAGFAGEVISWPEPGVHMAPTVDSAGALYVRGQVMTDEGSFTDDFQGSGLTTALTGTLNFTNNSPDIVGVGTKFLSEVNYYSVIKKSTDADTLFIQVDNVIDDTHLTLLTPYQGTTQTGQSAVKSNWITTVGTGASLSVGSSLVTIACGTTSGSIVGLWTVPDYIPFLGAFKLAIDNRRANQNIFVGWFDVAANPTPSLYAAFLFDGTTNTTVKCVSATSSAAADTQTTSVTLPNAVNSTASNVYRVAPWQGQVAFYVNDFLVAVHNQHIIPPYSDIRMGVYNVNTGVPAGATGITIDSAIYESIDRFDARVYNTNADFMQVTANGRTTTGVPVPLQVSAAGIAVVSGSGSFTVAQATATSLKMSGSTTPTNALATTTIGLPTVDFLMGYNGTTWDMVRAGANSNDAVGSIATGILATSAYLMGWNGGSWDRLRSTTANGLAADVTRVQGTVTVGGINAAGGGITGNPVRIGASTGAATVDVQADASGNLKIVGTGVAGTPAGGVLSVQGVVGGTALPVSGSVTTTPAVNVVDSNNSTTATLGANATYTGTSTDLLGYSSIAYSFYSDQSSATLGFIVQFSPDGTNWDDRVKNTYTFDGTVTDLVIRPHDRYFRIKYTNGATPQTVMRLQTILVAQSPALADSIGIDHPPTSGDDGMLVKAIMTGKSTAGGGTYVDVKVNPSGTLQIGSTVTPSDAFANPTDAVNTFALTAGYNGTTWDRIRTHGTNADTDTPTATGALVAASHLYGYNGTSWDRLRGTIANGLAVDVTRVQGSVTVAQATAASLNATVVQGNAGTAAQGWFARITDATNTAAVKAASTAAIATDPALVVAISPNNTVGVNVAQWIGSTAPSVGSKTSANSIPVVIASDQAAVAIKGASTPTDAFANPTTAIVSQDFLMGWNGATWDRLISTTANGLDVDVTRVSGNVTVVGASTPSDAFANPTTAQVNQTFGMVWNGTTWDRQKGTAALGAYVSGPVASGAAVPANPVFVGGSDGTNVRAIRTDTSGYAAVRVTDQTNFMPTMDAAARRGYITVTDGTNTMPTGDAAARGVYHRITDGTNTAAVKAASTPAAATDPALVVALSPNVGGTTGRLPVQLGGPGVTDSFSSLVTSNRCVQVSVPFFQATPTALATNPGAIITISGTGSSSQSLGRGVFNTGAGTTNQIKATTNITLTYNAHSELFAAFTVAFISGGVATSYQRIGPMDAAATPVNGFAFGYNNTGFGLWTIYNSTATFVAQASWNTDVLSGAAGSKFTLNGSPTALVPTNINLYRIRYGWLGIAPIIFEVLSPDGEWVIVHQTRTPGQQATVTTTTPNLPITLDIAKTAGATNITMYCGCWVGGSTESNECRPDGALQYNVSQNASAVSMMPANTARKKYTVFNDSTATMYVSHSGTASTTNFKYRLLAGQTWTDDFPCFCGAASVIWASGSGGAARVTEEF